MIISIFTNGKRKSRRKADSISCIYITAALIFKVNVFSDVKVKKFLNNVMQEELSPIRARRKEYENRIGDVYDILKKGSETAKHEAEKTLAEVKHAMKIDYFDTPEFLEEQVEKFK